MIFNKIKELKDKGLKIGITFSQFDLLHAGHIAMLSQAKNHCDYLIAGLQNNAQWDRTEKNGPIQSIVERQISLSAVRFVDEIIVYTHLNDKYPQFQNIIIPNIRSKHAYIYCDKLDKYILCDKDDILNELIDYRMTDLKGFYEKYSHKLTQKNLGYLERLFNFHYDKEYCQKKCIELNITFYNQSNKDNIKYNSINSDDSHKDENKLDC